MLILSDVAPPIYVKEKVMMSVGSAINMAKLLAVKDITDSEDELVQ